VHAIQQIPILSHFSPAAVALENEWTSSQSGCGPCADKENKNVCLVKVMVAILLPWLLSSFL